MNLIVPILVLFFSTIQTIVGESNCLSSFINFENQLLVLSDHETDANTARRICSSSGGSLARVTSQSATISNFLHRNLISKNLTEIKIYRTEPKFGFETFLFRKNNVNNAGSLETRSGRLNSFYLYINNKTKKNFSTKVMFCVYKSEKSVISNNHCSFEWKEDFYLYGGTITSTNTIKVYVYSYNTNPWSSNLFLNIQKRSNYYPPSFIFIPDISVFIGARSGVNQDNWLWNNGTMVNDLMFPTSNSSVCQQMSWPLTYNDGINLYPKECTAGGSHFICDIKFQIRVSSHLCNESLLTVSWNELNEITNDLENVHVKIQTNGIDWKTVPYNINSVDIGGLAKETKYNITVIVTIESTEQQLTVSDSAIGQTSSGFSNLKLHAKALDDNGICIITWPYKENIVSYKIYGFSGVLEEFHVTKNNYYNYTVNLTGFSRNSSMFFTIQALFCSEESKNFSVKGSCLTPSPSSSSIDTYVIIISSSALLLLASVFVGICVCKKKKTTSEETETGSCYMNEDKINSIQTKTSATNQDDSNIIYEQPQFEEVYDVIDTTQASPQDDTYKVPIDCRQKTTCRPNSAQVVKLSSIQTSDSGTSNPYENEPRSRDKTVSGETIYGNDQVW